jgi:type IV pilus assembly protein PilM
MGLFGQKKQSYLGVDIGSSGMKVVELLNEKGRARLFTYAFTERAPDKQSVSLIDYPKEASDQLRAIAAKAKVSTMRAVGGLPVSSVFSAVITVPRGSEKEMQEAIRYQAKKLIPVPLEEMVLDSKIIGGKDTMKAPNPKKQDKEKGAEGEKAKDPAAKVEKNAQVLITGASKAMVQKYVTIFKQAGLQLVSLETETLALIRSLVGKDRATTMIVDMGGMRTNIIIVEMGIPYVTRSLDMGGNALTRAMSKTLAMDMRSAEQMKTDIRSISSIYPGEGMPKIFESTIQPMLTELQYSMNLYAGHDATDGKTVEKIILTGGGAGLPALAGHLEKQLNTKTYVGDPWARVVYPNELRPVLDEIGPRYAVSVGLAMRDIE